MNKRLTLLTVLLMAMILTSFSSVQSSPISRTPSATTYYIDSVNGSDNNAGTSEAAPWKTLSRVNGTTFRAGDVVKFKRGSSWTGTLTIRSSGTNGNPITFTSYGSGKAPIITYPGGSINNKRRGILVYGNYVIVENFLVKDVFDDGIGLWSGASNNIVRRNEITNAGRGITIEGQYNKITENYIHDLHMVVNTRGGSGDYGATGINFYASNNEVVHNRIENCKAASYDYGVDGGAFEWWGTADGNYVYRNWAANNKGFAEVGGGSAKNTTIAYNVSLNNGKFTSIHTQGDSMGSAIDNFRVENNTVIEQSEGGMQYSVIWFGGRPAANAFLLRNNVFYVQDYSYLADADQKGWSFVHKNNLIYFTNPASKVGYSLGSGEIIADPLFVKMTGKNFRLRANSPAIDKGLGLGHDRDFANAVVPSGAGPDIGAYEYLGTGKATLLQLVEITPESGPAGGGTEVVLWGDDFQPGVAVFFGQSDCQNIQVLSSNEIQCLTPPNAPELVDITVVNPDQQSNTMTGGFYYTEDGQISAPVFLPMIAAYP